MNYLPLPNAIGTKAFTFASASSIGALIAGALAGWPPYVPNIASSKIIIAFLVVFDSPLLQLVAIIHCIICLMLCRSINNELSWKQWRDYILAIFIFFVLLGAYYFLNDYVFKAAFDRPRPDTQNQIKVGIITHLWNPTTNGGAPSGYAFRGAMIFLVSILSGLGVKNVGRGFWRRVFSDIRAIWPIQAALLILTCTARVRAGYHFWFDILLGLSLGTFAFWGLIVLASAFIYKCRLEDMEYFSTLIVAVIIGFIIIGFFYSRNAVAWAPTVISIMTLTLVVQIIGIIRKRRQNLKYEQSESENME